MLKYNDSIHNSWENLDSYMNCEGVRLIYCGWNWENTGKNYNYLCENVKLTCSCENIGKANILMLHFEWTIPSLHLILKCRQSATRNIVMLWVHNPKKRKIWIIHAHLSFAWPLRNLCFPSMSCNRLVDFPNVYFF